jgi:hypothetical protein
MCSIFVRLDKGLAVRQSQVVVVDTPALAGEDGQPHAKRPRVVPPPQSQLILTGMSPDARTGARLLNACGELMGPLVSRRPTHRAWIRQRTLFGCEWHAYTAAGNVALQFQRVTFKGAIDPGAIARIERLLFADLADPPLSPHAHLMVLQTSLNRSLYVNMGCLLERQLQDAVGWAAICSRCEEVCNVVPFIIIHWGAMVAHLGLTDDPVVRALVPPDTAMASVTRRGVLTLRLTWVRGTPWTSNDGFLRVTERLGRFLYSLV